MSLIVGLTGGIGSGKSVVAEMFRQRSARIISADSIAKDLVQFGEQAWKEIVSFFGDRILLENGEIDRVFLGKIVFNDFAKRKVLESILHPKIFDEEKRIYEQMIEEDPGVLVILEAALLIESGNSKNMDRVALVICNKTERIRRLIERDGLTRSEIEKRLEAQMEIDDKIKYADYVLSNEGTMADLEANVEVLYSKLKKQSKNIL